MHLLSFKVFLSIWHLLGWECLLQIYGILLLFFFFFTCHIYVLCVILCHGFSSDAVVNHLGIDTFTVSIGSIALLFGSYLVRNFLIFPLYILRTRFSDRRAHFCVQESSSNLLLDQEIQVPQMSMLNIYRYVALCFQFQFLLCF